MDQTLTSQNRHLPDTKATSSSNPLTMVWTMLLYFLFSRDLTVFDGENVVYATASKFASIIIYVFFFLDLWKNRCNKTYIKMVVAIILPFVSLFVSTLYQSGDVRRFFMLFYPILSMACLVSVYCKNRSALIGFLKGVAILYFVLSCINFIQIMLDPGMLLGERTIYFLGGENLIGYPLIIGTSIAFALHYLTNRYRLLAIASLAITSVTIAMVFSGSNVVGLAVYLIIMFIKPISSLIIKIGMIRLFVIFFSLFIFLIVLSNLSLIFENQLVIDIIEKGLGKNLTLTNRTLIWDVVVRDIVNSPILGYGVRDTFNLFTIHANGQTYTFSAHNQMLQSLYEGGFLFFIAIVPLIRLVSHRFKKCQYAKLKKLTIALIFTILVMYMAEAPGIDKILLAVILSISILTVSKRDGIRYSTHI